MLKNSVMTDDSRNSTSSNKSNLVALIEQVYWSVTERSTLVFSLVTFFDFRY